MTGRGRPSVRTIVDIVARHGRRASAPPSGAALEGEKPRAGRISFRGPLALALLAVVTAFATANVHAAFSSSANNAGNSFKTGTVAISDNDGGSAMLSLSSAPLGTTDTSCIKTSYSGSLPSEVRHYATASGALAPYLTLKVTRGTGANTFDNCSDFTADSTNYFGKGAGVIYDGKLSSYPTSWAAGVVDPAGPTSYSSAVGGTSGLVSYWRLGDNVVGFDDLTDSAGVQLQNHTGGLDATWTKHNASTSDTVFSDQNRVRRNGTEASLYYTSIVPSSADYLVEADVHVKSAAWDGAAVMGRVSTSANTYYRAGYFGPGGVWELYKVVDGTSTLLGSYAQTLTAGSDYRVSLAMQGSTIYLLVNGVQRVVATDTSITAAGRGGVRLGYLGATSTPDNTSGLHLDNFRISSLTTITAADSKGTNTGYYGGTVQVNQPGALSGETDRATRFDGTSGIIEVPSSASLQLTGNFSIEAWVKPDAVVGTRWILQKGTLYYLYLSNSDVVFGFWSGGSYRYVIAPGVASAGSWQHFVGTYDGSMVRIYKNGVEVASAAASGSIPTNATNLSIANLSGATTNTFTGTIDEVALYNIALAPADISAHYATGGGKESWTNPENHAYKFQITLDNDAAALGKSATATFHWEARNL